MNILILAPHPDDEVLGCGGVIIQHVRKGDQVDVVYLTNGEKGIPGMDEALAGQLRFEEANKVKGALGFSDTRFLQYRDGELTPDLSIAKQITQNIERDRIGMLYAPHEAEAHPDHQATGRIARIVRRQWDRIEHHWPLQIRLYEVWTPMLQYNHVAPVEGPDMWKKMQAANLYASQMSRVKFHIAAQGLARFRGEMNSVRYAEVFATI